MIPHRPAAVVCDMDGLLVDSERMERRVWRAAAADHGVELSDERFRTFVGHSADQCDRILLDYYGADFDVPAFRATCHRRMRALVEAEGVPLRAGAREWLRFLAGLDLPLGLATSSAPEFVPERLGELVELFRAVVTRADVPRGKPHPDLYLAVAERLGVEPAVCLAVEDSPAGARSALAAGMPVVVVPDLVSPPAELAASVSGVYASLDDVRLAAARAWGR
ncbi:MAG TPA: HAD family phosphatase [Longimicrobiaceae bacterium]